MRRRSKRSRSRTGYGDPYWWGAGPDVTVYQIYPGHAVRRFHRSAYQRGDLARNRERRREPPGKPRPGQARGRGQQAAGQISAAHVPYGSPRLRRFDTPACTAAVPRRGALRRAPAAFRLREPLERQELLPHHNEIAPREEPTHHPPERPSRILDGHLDEEA